MRDFHLSTLDQTMLRMYVRHLIIFPFPDSNLSDRAYRALRSGFIGTLVRLPFLAGTIAPKNGEAGRLGLQYPTSISDEIVDEFFMSNLESNCDSKFDYETMESAGFPPSSLPPDLFCPDVLKNHPGLDDAFAAAPISYAKGLPVPVFAGQTGFIPGGLVLSMYFHHTAIDGSGISQIYEIWSECMRSPVPDLPYFARSSDMDFVRHQFDRLCDPHSTNQCPEARLPGLARIAPRLRDTPYNLVAKIFTFSASKVSGLVHELYSRLDTHVSNFTALIALLWTQITIARSSYLLANDIRNTKLCIAYDHRKNLGQDYASYLGNCATGMLVTKSTSAMLSRTSDTISTEFLAPIALDIVQSLSLIDLAWLKDRCSLFSRTENSYQIQMDIDVMNGPDIFVTSWMHMGADCAWNIPGTSQSYPAAIRKPQSKVEGNIHFLPRSKMRESSKDFEVMICLEEGEMERVSSRMKKQEWIQRIVDA